MVLKTEYVVRAQSMDKEEMEYRYVLDKCFFKFYIAHPCAVFFFITHVHLSLALLYS